MTREELWRRNREYISRPVLDPLKIEAQFVDSGLRRTVTAGNIDITSGRVTVGDPLAYLGTGKLCPTAEVEIPDGSYPVQLAVSLTDVEGPRICTARLKISRKRPVSYRLAEAVKGTEPFRTSDGNYCMIPVDAGMMAFADAKTAEAYGEFLEGWHRENPEGNHYDDYFAPMFRESAEKQPEVQRAGGDFISFTVPGTQHSLVMNAAGFGDGLYSLFVGIDEEGQVCELTVPLIDPEDLEKANDDYNALYPGYALCIATRHVADGGAIAYMCRNEPMEEFPDSGWRFYGYEEDDEYWDNSENYTYLDIHTVAEMVPEVVPFLQSPVGSQFFGDESGNFVPIDEED